VQRSFDYSLHALMNATPCDASFVVLVSLFAAAAAAAAAEAAACSKTINHTNNRATYSAYIIILDLAGRASSSTAVSDAYPASSAVGRDGAFTKQMLLSATDAEGRLSLGKVCGPVGMLFGV
jgi:hypothetical protein